MSEDERLSWVFLFFPSVKGLVLQGRWCGYGIRRGWTAEPWARYIVPDEIVYANNSSNTRLNPIERRIFFLRRARLAMLSKLRFELKLEEVFFGYIAIPF